VGLERLRVGLGEWLPWIWLRLRLLSRERGGVGAPRTRANCRVYAGVHLTSSLKGGVEYWEAWDERLAACPTTVTVGTTTTVPNIDGATPGVATVTLDAASTPSAAILNFGIPAGIPGMSWKGVWDPAVNGKPCRVRQVDSEGDSLAIARRR